MQSVNNKSLIEELDKLLERLRIPPEVFSHSLLDCLEEDVLIEIYPLYLFLVSNISLYKLGKFGYLFAIIFLNAVHIMSYGGFF